MSLGDVAFAGGFTLGGAVIGLYGSYGLAEARDRRSRALAGRVALRIVISELELSLATYRETESRGSWWTPTIEPRFDAWSRFDADLARVLDMDSDVWFALAKAYRLMEVNNQIASAHPRAPLNHHAPMVSTVKQILEGGVVALKTAHAGGYDKHGRLLHGQVHERRWRRR